MGKVLMRHPDRDDTVEVQERAFEGVWKKKGWELVNPYTDEGDSDGGDDGGFDNTATDPEETRIPVLEDVDEPTLRAMAKDLGIEGADTLTANELRSLIGNTPEFYATEDYHPSYGSFEAMNEASSEED